jgi:hypothetical protein
MTIAVLCIFSWVPQLEQPLLGGNMKVSDFAVGWIWFVVLVLFLIYAFPDILQSGGWVQ